MVITCTGFANWWKYKMFKLKHHEIVAKQQEYIIIDICSKWTSAC